MACLLFVILNGDLLRQMTARILTLEKYTSQNEMFFFTLSHLYLISIDLGSNRRIETATLINPKKNSSQ